MIPNNQSVFMIKRKNKWHADALLKQLDAATNTGNTRTLHYFQSSDLTAIRFAG